MGQFTDDIRLVNVDGMTDFERIDSNLRALIVTMEGTLPGSRGFGLNPYVDSRPYDLMNEFAAELDDKVEQFIPDIRIEDVEFDISAGGTDGVVGARIFIGRNEEAGG